MMSIFPRDDVSSCQCTTRMPIRAKLTRGPAKAAYLEVFKYNGGADENDELQELIEPDGRKVKRRVISVNHGAIEVRRAMMQFVPTGVSMKYYIKLTIQGPNIPSIMMIDLPGMVNDPTGTEPTDIGTDSVAITDAYIEKYKDKAIFLAVVSCYPQINRDPVLSLIRNKKIEVYFFHLYFLIQDIWKLIISFYFFHAAKHFNGDYNV